MGTKKDLKNYVFNEDFIDKSSKKDIFSEFVIYKRTMNENLKKGLKMRDLFEKCAIQLSDCIPIFNPNHLIIRNILDYLVSKKTLSKLVNVS